MDQYNQTPNQNPAPSFSPTPAPHESSWGPIIATVIILAALVFGGLYFWGQRSSNNNVSPAGTVETNQSGALNSTSIEQDLNTTDVNNLDSQINAS